MDIRFGVVLFFLLCHRVWCDEVPCAPGCIICTTEITKCNVAADVTELTLQESSLAVINDGAFRFAEQLIHINLSGNPITTIELGAFNNLTNLLSLDLSHNELASIPDQLFAPLTNLETLNISYNHISSITMNTFSGLGMLKTLCISSNQISILLQDVFNALPSLTEIKLSDNPWKCDCNITSLYELITSPSMNITVLDASSATCSTPTDYENTTISALDLFTSPSCYSIPSSTPMSSIYSIYVSSASTMVFSSTLSAIMVSSSTLPTHSSVYSTSISSTSTMISSSTLSAHSTVYFTYIPSTSTMVSSSPHSTVSSTSMVTILSNVATSNPIPLPTSMITCPRDITVSEIGTIIWEDITVGEIASAACPYGPFNATASRSCFLSHDNNNALWKDVQHDDCNIGSTILYAIQEITNGNAENISNLVANLPIKYFKESDLRKLVNISSQLIQTAPSNTMVIYNVLAVADLIIVENFTLSQDTVIRLQKLVNTALINAVNSENPEIILNFTHLLTGAKYLERDSMLEVYVNNTEIKFTNSSQSIPSEVMIAYKNIQGLDVIQVTIYNDPTSGIYPNHCTKIKTSSRDCNSTIISSIAVLVSNHSGIDIPAYVTFNNIQIKPNHIGVCSIWNATLFDWDASVCKTLHINDTYTCNCSSYSGIAIVETSPSATTTKSSTIVTMVSTSVYNNSMVPSSSVVAPPNSTHTSLPILLTLYISGGIGILLHVPVILASIVVCCRYDFVRNIQALLFHCVAQMLTFVFIVVSYERTEISEVCLSLGSLLHYFILVTLIWLMFRPIVFILSHTNRLLYEKDCFILPFFFMAWALPIIPVVIYGILTVSSFEDEIINCWLESISFPNYFTYLSPICFIIITFLVIGTAIILRFGDYSIPGSTYIQLVDILLEAIVFCIIIGFQFLTATITQYNDTLVVITAALILLSGLYSTAANLFGRSKLRKAIICHFENIYSQGRQFAGQDTPSTVSSTKSTKVLYHNQRQQKLQHGMNLDYIEGYLGYPFEIWSEVEDGQRVRKKRFVSKEKPYSSSEV